MKFFCYLASGPHTHAAPIAGQVQKPVPVVLVLLSAGPCPNRRSTRLGGEGIFPFRSPCVSSSFLTCLGFLLFSLQFSKNDIIVRDRNEFVSHNQTHGRRTTRSRLGQMLVIRAQEVLDKNKSARIASLDNVHANLLLEPILCRSYLSRIRGTTISPRWS